METSTSELNVVVDEDAEHDEDEVEVNSSPPPPPEDSNNEDGEDEKEPESPRKARPRRVPRASARPLAHRRHILAALRRLSLVLPCACHGHCYTTSSPSYVEGIIN